MDKLIKRALRRDADAFTELMQAQMQSMYKTARAMLRDDEDAADAISETILMCWEKMEQLCVVMAQVLTWGMNRRSIVERLREVV